MKDKLLCPFRRKYVANTPEERVRQQFLHAMVQQYEYPQSLIAVEVPIEIGNHVCKRCDAVVYTHSLKPLMLLEFKAPDVTITQKTLDQAAAYNTTINAPWLVLCNGKQAVVAHIHEGNIEFKDTMPKFEELMHTSSQIMEERIS